MRLVEWVPPCISTTPVTTHIRFFVHAKLYVNVEKMSWIWEIDLLMANGLNIWNGMLSNLQQTQETKMTIASASKNSLTMI